jgi:hypothetical protein
VPCEMILITFMGLGSDGWQYVISLQFCYVFFEEISKSISREKLANG